MARKVAIIGCGMTPFKARWPEKTYFELAYDACNEALHDAGITIKDVDSAVYGIYNDLFERQFMADIFVNDYIGNIDKPGTRVTTGGATGGFAVRTGFMEIASGLADISLVLGVEKCNDCYDKKTGTTTPEVLKAIAYSVDLSYEAPLGMLAASSYVMLVNAHLYKYGNPTEEQMAKVSIKNHGNAFNNPKAQAPMKLTIEDVLNSRIICYPFKMLDCCLYSEASAALILASAEKVKELKIENPIWITGVGAACTDAFIGNRANIGALPSNIAAAKQAYKMAGLDYKTVKNTLDVAELHDAFTGQEVISYEELGFVEYGKGGSWLDDGGPEMTGELPVNPSGGLIGCGHAVGATGVMSSIESCLQLQERAGKRQVPITKGRAISHSIGGPGAAYAAIIVLER